MRRCLDSVCAQDDCVKEIVLVNDGSTDGSLAICNEYADKDKRFKIIDKQNEGISAAIIDGVKASSCEYIGFVDSDDYIEVNMFSELAAVAEKFDADIAVCSYDDADENGNTFGRRDFGIGGDGIYTKTNGRFPFQILPTFADTRYVAGMRWNKIYRRELLLDNIAFKKTDIKMGEDMALIIPVMMSANSIAYTDKCLYHYFQRSNSVVHSYKRTFFYDWKKILCELKNAQDTYCYVHDKFDEAALILLWSNTIKRIRYSRLTRAQKKKEYAFVGNDPYVKELLNRVELRLSFKRRLIFKLLKHKMYGILALI